MQEEGNSLGRFSQAAAPQQPIRTLNHPAADDAGVEPPNDYEGGESAVIRIVLADSETIYRVGIRKIFALEDDICVIAQVDTLASLLSTIQRFPTDVILLGDLLGTVDAIPELVRRAPELKIIVQSARNDESNTVELYRRGVRGIIPRSISPDLLVKCVRKIAAGEAWIDNQSTHWVIEAYRSQATALASPRTQLLSHKEMAIVTYIMHGKRNKEIADLVGTSEQVVKNHLRKVYSKLGVSDRLELALYCLHHQLHKKATGTVAAIGAPVAEPLAINRNKL
jgi:two-component system, NarL family, nitrate/nitrite response regulator NarL